MSDFERYVAEHNIPEEDWPAAFARWIAERTSGPVPGFPLRATGNPDGDKGSSVASGWSTAGHPPARVGFLRRDSCCGLRKGTG